jgi:hypothetical protein
MYFRRALAAASRDSMRIETFMQGRAEGALECGGSTPPFSVSWIAQASCKGGVGPPHSKGFASFAVKCAAKVRKFPASPCRCFAAIQ